MRRRRKGSRNKRTLEREKAERIAAARAELAKNAPAIDYAASYDSLDIMEKVMRHFYLRGLIEEKMGAEADWKAVDAAFVQAAAIAEKVAKYRHAQLSAVRLGGDINARVTDNASLDELLVKIKSELAKLGPIIDLDVAREPQVSRTEGGSTWGIEPSRARGACGAHYGLICPGDLGRPLRLVARAEARLLDGTMAKGKIAIEKETAHWH
jgi:hypothetical protein